MIVLTGPTGNVGAEVARLFARAAVPGAREPQAEVPFRIAAHHPDAVRAELGDDAPVVAFDYDDRSTWPAALEGVERLFLVFPLPSPRMVDQRMVPLIDAAVAAGCRHVVYLTVPGADRQKVVPHHRVERHIEASGADHTFLRASFFMQNLHRTLSTHGVDIVEHGEVFVPAGRGRTTFVDAADVAEVARQALLDPAAHRNVAYTLTGSEQLTMDQVATVLTEVLGRPVRYARPSLPRFWWRMRRRGVGVDTIAFMSIVYTLTRLGKNEPMTGELAALLGRRPTDLRTWAGRTRWRWEQQAWT